MKREFRPSNEQGFSERRRSDGAFDHEFIQTPLASLSTPLLADLL
jgi:hypothetical protein